MINDPFQQVISTSSDGPLNHPRLQTSFPAVHTYLTHALAVSDFGIVHGVGSENVKERLLLDPISFAEHDVIAISPIHVEVDLTHVVRVLARSKAHRLVNAILLLELMESRGQDHQSVS